MSNAVNRLFVKMSGKNSGGAAKGHDREICLNKLIAVWHKQGYSAFFGSAVFKDGAEARHIFGKLSESVLFAAVNNGCKIRVFAPALLPHICHGVIALNAVKCGLARIFAVEF